jgi:protein-disulfide isomerase
MTMKNGFIRTVMATSMLVSALMVSGAQAQLAANAPTASEATNAPIKMELLEITGSDKVLGNPDAPVTIVEYASLSCTHCAHFHNDILPKVKEAFIDTGKAKLVMRNFPLNEPALRGAMLANCVAPEQYYTFLKVLFQMQDKWAFSESFKDNLSQIAGVGGVSPEQFGKCMSDMSLEKQALTTRKDAEEGLKIASTPTFFINGTRLEGAQPFDEFSKAVNAALAAVPAKAAK